ncbi:TonB-dependent receptor [Shewanella oneidensis MR-1]|uniref:Outer membrane long-chain fatty acid receptor FadL family n=1 Tax=Shewanella oneidensis (strain ATCC 700550 / JCM 31522 / CIP 106686 / LMG 19005 / NCIMB 14063 / MR-1) TaxID=211586 RepID=Q8ECN7_SHEON|nr:outer membrane protein transport protein [Shewanella oneidensis]AAN56105.1 outer membrane long-chain fatty acid receptor FadL family [Shewanella oneidensis MR-1]MDX5999463.1 outer membrane protein transport protein [Shewanella oneidensis]MEE2028297.1 Long-chain fatty acid transport protein [Shewanella oneidensis]QKG97539.1 TonB-dependent receptor [Shewanella oneidensis MR-1]
MKSFNKTLLTVAIALASSQTFASGFQLNSQSATGMGRAFAGDAVIADNATVLSRNPAAMALFDKDAISFGLTYADITVDVKDVNFNLPNGAVDLGSIDDAGSSKVIPNIFYIHPIDDKFAVGFAAFSNFGTGTDASSLSKNLPKGSPAPYDLLGETEVTTVNFNASVSYRINDIFSIGAGVDAIYGEGRLTRNASTTPLVDVDADGWAFGGILGATVELDKDNRFGISYRFSPTVNVEGDINTISTKDLSAAGLGSKTALATNFDSLDVPLADIFQVAGFHQITPKFALHYTAQYTQWSKFDQITAKDGVATIIPGQAGAGIKLPAGDIALKEYQWKDSWLFSLGGTYTINEQFTVRAGYMHDQGVVDEISSISFPDSDRNWYTAGMSYHINPQNTVDFGIAFIKGEEVHLIENSAITGPVNAITESSGMYYSVQYSYQF